MPSLNTDTGTICRLVDLAREFHAQESVSFPEQPAQSIDDWGVQILASHAGDASVDEFNSIIEDLEPDQQQMIVALFWLGRGDYTVAEWDEALEQARADQTPQTAGYLIGHPLLADYLLEGLDILGFRCE